MEGHTDVGPRRWVRSSAETCVASIQRSRRLLSQYVASYRMDDPQWAPLLELPCGNPVALEIRARHVNYGLRHLVQKGHALYIVHSTDHTVLHPRGLATRTHVTCALDGRDEHLLTQMVHEGPLDAEDPDGPVGVVAMSLARSVAGPFHRRPMLWQRSRRVGALQAQLGAYDWVMHDPHVVGRADSNEVLLLKNETTFVGGGLTTKGICSSLAIAHHPYHYTHQFEAPPAVGVDAMHQAAYLCAARNETVDDESREPLHALAWSTRTPYPWMPIELDLPFYITCSSPQVHRTPVLPELLEQHAAEQARRESEAGETVLGGTKRGNKKGSSKQQSPLMNDKRPTKGRAKRIQTDDEEGTPEWFAAQAAKHETEHAVRGAALISAALNEGRAHTLPPRTIGTPYHVGGAILHMEVGLKQGAPEYTYDQGPSSRSSQWWSQKFSIPYESSIYLARDGQLENLVLAETPRDGTQRTKGILAPLERQRKSYPSAVVATNDGADKYGKSGVLAKRNTTGDGEAPRPLTHAEYEFDLGEATGVAGDRTHVTAPSHREIQDARTLEQRLERYRAVSPAPPATEAEMDARKARAWDAPEPAALRRASRANRAIARIMKQQESRRATAAVAGAAANKK
jgi:hypothetical protein